MAREAHVRRDGAVVPDDDGGPPARARRFREAVRCTRADLTFGASVPAHAGVRLRRDRGRHRGWGDGPALQPARRPRRYDAVRARATDGDHLSAADRPRWRGKDVEVERQLRRGPGPARRDVREGDVDPGRPARTMVVDLLGPGVRAGRSDGVEAR